MKTEEKRARWRKWYYRQSKEKHREKMRKWRELNPERWHAQSRESSRKSGRKRRLEIRFSDEWYQERLKAQNGCCAICGELFTETPRIDHDHISGETRGLLCNPCNLGIGILNDDPELLRKAALYLESFLSAKAA